MQTAMGVTPQQPTQRTRIGELPEGLSGSTKSVVCVERSVKHVGGPDGSWGGSRRSATPKGRLRTVRASDPLRVRGAGRAVHRGKGRTVRRSRPRKHGPHMQDRTPMPTSLQGIAQKDLRKRVLLKSPVRENRTPGSVRGRSGNWPSYRDGFYFRWCWIGGAGWGRVAPQGCPGRTAAKAARFQTRYRIPCALMEHRRQGRST